MAETNLIDEWHITVRIPNDLPEDKLAAVRRTLADNEFLERLRLAVRAVFLERPELEVAALSLTR